MEVVIKALQFILSLSILVVLHEFGHFFFAKLFKIRVEKFYLFFNPGFSLFKFRIGETEYGMGWVPFGGYVKIAGMVDESMDNDFMNQPPKEYEFRSRPAWQRLLVMIGGVLMNLITAVTIYIFMSMSYDTSYIDNKHVTDGYAFSEYAKEIGFMDGDKIVSVDGKSYGNFKNIVHDIIVGAPEYVEIERNGEIMRIEMKESYIPQLLKETSFMNVRIPMIVGTVEENTPAYIAGLMQGDSLTGLNDKKFKYKDEFTSELKKSLNSIIKIEFMRDGKLYSTRVRLGDKPLFGIYVDEQRGIQNYIITSKSYSFFEAIPEGFRRAGSTISSYIDQMKLVFNPKTEAYKSVGSVISMGKVFSPVWDWHHFWHLTALYSIVLAVMNILPIPALDGGHVIFLLYEVVARRTPNEKFMDYAQITGMFLLFALILLALGNDIYKLFT